MVRLKPAWHSRAHHSRAHATDVSLLDMSLCPVCGNSLSKPAWRGDLASFEICRSCGTQFGYQDHLRTPERYAELREQWVASGMRWWSKSNGPPPGWDPEQQLRRVSVEPPR